MTRLIINVGDATFGEHTKVGQGGLSTDVADGVYGEFSVSAGVMTPNTSPLSVGAVNVGGVGINVLANTVSVRGTAEIISIIQDEAHINNRTIQYRGDAEYAEINAFGAFNTSTLTGRVVIEPDRLNPNPWQWFTDQGSGAHVLHHHRHKRCQFGRNWRDHWPQHSCNHGGLINA